MNVLVTGGMGNLGSRLAARLTERGDRVTVLDLRPEPLEDSPAFRLCHRLTGDIADPAILQPAFEQGRFDSVFHLAALLSADSERDAKRAWRVNLEGTRQVLHAAVQHGVSRLVFSSSTASFGPGLPPPVGVDSPQWPASLYGATKVAGERLGVYFHHRFGLDFRGLRIPAVVAPRGAGGGATAFCSELFAHAVRHGRYEFYVEPAAGRPLIYIDDAVRALLALHDAPADNLSRRVYQVAGTPATAREMAAAVLERLPHAEFTYRPEPVRNAIVLSLPLRFDDAHAVRDWQWAPRYDLPAMTARMIEELQKETP
jgi:threonine 3-dehydrogenase